MAFSNFNRRVRQHTHDIEALYEIASETKEEVKQLSSQVGDLTIRVEGIDSKIDLVDMRLTETNERVDYVGTQIAALTSGQQRQELRIEEMRQILYRHGDKIDRLESRFAKVGNRLTAVEDKLVAHDTRFDTVDARFDTMDARFNTIDTKFDTIDIRFNTMDTRFDTMDTRFETMETQFAEMLAILRAGVTTPPQKE